MRPQRSAFTLLQLLVLLALLLLVFALLLPQLVRARAEAVQNAKLNNLKQLALGVINYADTNDGRFPPGNDANNFSVSARILPFIEQSPLYQKIDFTKPSTDPANAEVRKAVIKVFLSPLDPRMTVDDKSGPTNYLWNAGTKASLIDNDGIFYQDSKTKFPASIPDGTSNTIMVGETLKGDGGTKAEDVARQHVELGKEALKNLKEDAGVQDWKDSKNIVGNRCASWLDGRFLQGTFNSGRVPNDSRPDVSCAGLGGWSALRSTADKVSVSMCDGSARFVKAKIDPEVWKALITPAGGEVIPDF